MTVAPQDEMARELRLEQGRQDATRRAKRIAWRRRAPLVPALVVLVVLTQIPFVVTIGISLFRWNLMYPNDTHFAWFENYGTVVSDPRLRAAIVNTVVLVVAGVLGALLIGTCLALLLNRKFFGRGVVRTLLITPFLVMPMASSLMWKHLIYNPDYGLINGTLDWVWQLFGKPYGPTIDMVSSYPMLAVIIVLIWTWTPFMMLIMLAGLQSQDTDVVEAAMVDGAGVFARFRYLTVPHLRQYAELCIVMGTIYLLNTYDQVFAITQGGPGTATTNLPYEIYLTEFRKYDYGEGAAAGVLVVLVSMIVATFGLRVVSSLSTQTPATGGKR
jgi:sorbitol/mannitol transport system permease protein